MGTPAVANGVVYVGSGDGKLHVFDASGSAMSKCPLDDHRRRIGEWLAGHLERRKAVRCDERRCAPSVRLAGPGLTTAARWFTRRASCGRHGRVEGRAGGGHRGNDCRMAKPLDWQALLVDGYEPLKKAQRIFRRLPRDPRCKLCQNPFAGIGGKLVGLIGRKPSRKNPNLCQYCFDHLPSGGIEIDIGVVFADVRGFDRRWASSPPRPSSPGASTGSTRPRPTSSSITTGWSTS